jgi:hypothetical protein
MGKLSAKKRPAKKRPRCVVSIHCDLHARIKAVVDPKGQKIQWLAEQAISEYLDRMESPYPVEPPE